MKYLKSIALLALMLLSSNTSYAQYKITDYTADTSPTGDDVVPTVNDPSGTPAMRQVTLGDLKTYINTGSSSGSWVAGSVGINTTSSVGIGSTNPGQKLDVQGTVRAIAFSGDGSALTGVGATVTDPTSTIGLSTVNGSASTAMRSDGSPALSQAISPTWTGNHTFSPASGDTIITSGNVGIGTASPGRLLDVNGNLRINSIYALYMGSDNKNFLVNSVGDQSGGISVWINNSQKLNFSSNAGTAVYFVSGKNVGIGTNIPQASLEITKSSTNPYLSLSNGSGENGNVFNITNSGYVGIGTVNPIAQNANYIFNITDSSSNSNRALALTNKNSTGTNTTSRFELVSADSNGFLQNTPTTFTLASAWAGKTMLYNETGLGTIVGTAGGATPIQFMTSGTTEAMRVMGSNVGIGSTNPNATLSIKGAGATSATTALQVRNSSGTNTFLVNNAGNVGIGSASPGTALDVQGSVRFSGLTAAHALCPLSNGAIGVCTTVVAADGSCTCN